MMRSLDYDVLSGKAYPQDYPKLIKRPLKKKKQKSWDSYYRWWVSHRRTLIWMC